MFVVDADESRNLDLGISRFQKTDWADIAYGVLKQSCDDYRNGLNYTGTDQDIIFNFKTAKAWFNRNSRDHIFDFLFICDKLNISPEYIRKIIND